MHTERIDCNTHEMVGRSAISKDTLLPQLNILTSPWMAESVLPADIFPSGVMYSENLGEEPWSTSHLTNREISGFQVWTQVSTDINREMFTHPFTPHVVVVEKYPEGNSKDGHWHIKMSPYMDEISHREIYDFLRQLDPLVRESIGYEIAIAIPICKFGEGENIIYNASAVEIEIGDDNATARIGLVTSAGPEDEFEVMPLVDEAYPGSYIYKISADLQDVFPFLVDLAVPDWEITLGVAVNDGEDLYEVFQYITNKKEGFTSAEVYRYMRPFVRIRKKEEGGVE